MCERDKGQECDIETETKGGREITHKQLESLRGSVSKVREVRKLMYQQGF